MPIDRMQRLTERLLDQADAAVARRQWDEVREICDAVLRLDPDSADARRLLAAAGHDTGLLGGSAAGPSTGMAPPGQERPCATCGSAFRYSRASARYCSHACRQAAYVARREARLERQAPQLAGVLCPGSTLARMHYIADDALTCDICAWTRNDGTIRSGLRP